MWYAFTAMKYCMDQYDLGELTTRLVFTKLLSSLALKVISGKLYNDC